MTNCGFRIFDNCDGVNCERYCSDKIDLSPMSKELARLHRQVAIALGFAVGLTGLSILGLIVTTKEAWHRVQIAEEMQ